MLNNKSTTFVLLERGVEDVALVKELKELERFVGMASGPVLSARDFYIRFPKLTQLRQQLEDEL